METCKCHSCPQKYDKQLTKNYMPISLLPICAKLFEKILFNNIYNYLISNNLITSQSGFIPGDSTTNQLLYLTHIIRSLFDSSMSLEVRHVFLDMSKAFGMFGMKVFFLNSN